MFFLDDNQLRALCLLVTHPKVDFNVPFYIQIVFAGCTTRWPLSSQDLGVLRPLLEGKADPNLHDGVMLSLAASHSGAVGVQLVDLLIEHGGILPCHLTAWQRQEPARSHFGK